MTMPRVAFVLLVLSCEAGVAASAAVEGASVAAVWSREDDYWRFLKAADVESYVSLWHEDFIGWPCGQDHPRRKAQVGGRVQEIRDKKLSVRSTLTREGAQEFGNVVVVHYRVTIASAYPDGREESPRREVKITHTWLQVGDTWQIIGGMCGSVAEPAK